MTEDLERRFVSAMWARAALRALVALLRPAGIRVMPVKGVLLQSGLYGVRWRRPISDVDVLIPQGDHARALRVLQSAGCSCARNDSREHYVYIPGQPFLIDLHRRLLLPATFGLDTTEVFARARRDTQLFGCEVWLPDHLDVYAHLLGHLMSSRSQPAPEHLADFASVAQAARLDPSTCARHLMDQGLGRAARYVLPELTRRAHDEFARAVLAELPRDLLGGGLAACARRCLRHIPQHHPAGALFVHGLGRSLPAGCCGLALRAFDRLSRARGAHARVPTVQFRAKRSSL